MAGVSTNTRIADPVEIAVAILRCDGRILARCRRAEEPLPGVWEFPGGKLEPGESPLCAVVREVREELGVKGIGLTLRETIEHAYPERSVRLHVFEGTCAGEPFAADGAEWAWLTPAELSRRPLPDANRDLVARLAAAHPARDP